MVFDKQKLLDKCEAMTLLCTKASTHWSFIKFCFNIPLVITSSPMCIINSISEDANVCIQGSGFLLQLKAPPKASSSTPAPH